MPRKPTDDGPRRPFSSSRGPRKGAPGRAGARFDDRPGDGFAKRPGAKAGAKPGFKSGAKPGFRKGPAKPGAGPERPPRDERPRSGSKTRTTLARPPRADLPAPVVKERERVAKVIARAGLGSRREIEEWIEAGRVAVNGQVLDSPAFTVAESDRIEVDGAPLPEKERTRLFLFHKPRGLVTTTDDPEGRPTVFDVLPAGLPRLVSVGRLDFNTEGLLLLTNDGGLARVLELPETGWLRRYRARAFGEVTQDQLDRLAEGVEVEGFQYGPIEAVLDREQGSNVWITVALREGKKREIRTVLGALGVHVNRLIRVSYGPFQLGELAEGAIEEIKTRVLRDQIGEQLAALAGADFDAPLRDYDEVKPARREPARKEPVRTERPARPERPERPARDRFEDRPECGERRGRPERSDRPLREPSNRRKPSIWRAAPEGEEVPKRRLPRRERAAIPPASEDTRPKRRGKTEDRKGRSILVERVGSPAPPPEASAMSAERARPFIRHGDNPPGDRPFKPRGDKPFRDRGEGGERPFRARSERPEGDRPFKPRGDRPFRDRGEGGERPFRARSERPEGDRPFKPRGDRPFRERGEGGERPFRTRSERPEGDRPFKPRGDRPFRDRGEGGERPFRARSERPEGDRPFKPRGDRPFRDRGEGGERPFRARGDRPEGDRPFKPRGDRPGGKFGGNKFGGKPGGARPGRPGGKPGFGKPGFDKPRGPRKPRPE
ncbi:pseudouridine synthase [Blastochloris tepida]|uniref:Pseudouridine synthase n=1 Tax=Blastochloris tepida TaxID=2233851 RepID=A0A348FVW5_9HYPH|nr:pseudouridine synthase [Blastochloris tepida]BBF91448.1 pseudouridine synthase [Blastochloris tepida]